MTWRDEIQTWDQHLREDWIERSCIIHEGSLDMSWEQARRQAYEQIKARMAQARMQGDAK